MAAAGADGADHRPRRHPIAHRDGRGDRLDGAPQPVVVPDGQHGSVDHDPGERHHAGARRQHGRADGCVEVDAAVPRSPRHRRAVERLEDDDRVDRSPPRVGVRGTDPARRPRPEHGAGERQQRGDEREQHDGGDDAAGEREDGHGTSVRVPRARARTGRDRPGDATRPSSLWRTRRPRRAASRTSRRRAPAAGPGPGARPVDSFLRPVRAGRHRASSPTHTPPPPRRERCVRRAGAGSGPGPPRGPGVGKGVAPGVLPDREAPTTGRAGAPRCARDHCARPRRGRAEGPPWPS